MLYHQAPLEPLVSPMTLSDRTGPVGQKGGHGHWLDWPALPNYHTMTLAALAPA